MADAKDLKIGSLIRIHHDDFNYLAIVTMIDDKWISIMPQSEKIVTYLNTYSAEPITIIDWFTSEDEQEGVISYLITPEIFDRVEVLGDVWDILSATINTK